MDIVEKILQNVTWPLTAFFGGLTSLIISIIVFREQFAQLLYKLSPSLVKRLSHISIMKCIVGPAVVQVEFGQRIQKAKARAKGVEETVAASRAMSAPNLIRDLGKQTTREVVIAAWGALQQIVYDACTASKLPLTPATRIPEAVRRLGNAHTINAEIVSLLDVLGALGQKLADKPAFKPRKNDAKIYKAVADVLGALMRLNLPAPMHVEKPTPRRQTVVGGHMPQPQEGSPGVWLVGIDGPVRDQRFSLVADNDLCITGDEYVSSHHALLRYAQGSLFLCDQESRNGSFLNEKPVTGTPVMVRPGDHIRLGASIFQVAAGGGQPSRARVCVRGHV